MKCLHCSSDFEIVHLGQLYCNKVCRIRAVEARKYAARKLIRSTFIKRIKKIKDTPLPKFFQRECRECGAAFTAKTPIKVFCSQKCLMTQTRNRLSKNTPVFRETRACARCGTDFTAVRFNHHYCSKNCSGKRYKICSTTKRKIIDRAGSCESCGFSVKAILHIHHINNNSMSNEHSNLMVLCPNCHYSFHSVVGYSTKTEAFERADVLKTIASLQPTK